jgi:hypothetical protein
VTLLGDAIYYTPSSGGLDANTTLWNTTNLCENLQDGVDRIVYYKEKDVKIRRIKHQRAIELLSQEDLFKESHIRSIVQVYHGNGETYLINCVNTQIWRRKHRCHIRSPIQIQICRKQLSYPSYSPYSP